MLKRSRTHHYDEQSAGGKNKGSSFVLPLAGSPPINSEYDDWNTSDHKHSNAS